MWVAMMGGVEATRPWWPFQIDDMVGESTTALHARTHARTHARSSLPYLDCVPYPNDELAHAYPCQATTPKEEKC